MDDKALKILELYKILKTLSNYAIMEKTKERLLELRPMKNTNDVLYALKETDEARRITIARKRIPLVPLADIGGAVKRVKIGASLSCGELLACAHILRVVRVINSYIDFQNYDEDFPILSSLTSSLSEDRSLEQKIFDCILSDDEVADDASVTLASIRRKKSALTNKVKDILNNIIHSPNYAQALRDPIISVRGDRYVVPVKSEYKKAVPGVVHDSSATGGTLFVEPMKVVETNNEIRRLTSLEKEEIDKILAELSEEVSVIADALLSNYNTFIKLDAIFAKAAYADSIEASMPVINDNQVIKIKKARHPLIPKNVVVPVDIALGGKFDTLVITGPNTGGKTVCLKILGLFSLMCACGLHTPCAEGSQLCVFDSIFADIGDEQSIEQSLSTFSAHMVNISDILKKCRYNSLVLFDELGAGTDPGEGAALAEAILKEIRKKGALCAATTHYSEIKMFALTTDGVENAACEFDVETLRPTYRLNMGTLGKSCAFEIAQRLGLDEGLISEARKFMTAENLQFEDIVNSLESAAAKAEKDREEAEKNRTESQKIMEKLRDEDYKTREKRDKILNDARREAKKLLDNAKKEIDNKIKEAEKAAREKSESDKIKALQKAKQDISHRITGIEDKISDTTFKVRKKVKPNQLLAGTTVFIPSMNSKGTAINPPDKNGNLEVMVGILKIKTHIDSIELAEDENKKTEKSYVSRSYSTRAVSSEIDLRGMTLDEAIATVDKYIDDAVMSHLNTVTIIHGRGTGVLKSGITNYLRSNCSVKSFRLGKFGEGGDGVTVVELR